jgi:hypothetical protein
MTNASTSSGSLSRILPAAVLFAGALAYAFIVDGPTRLVSFPDGSDHSEPEGIVVAFRNDDLTVQSDPLLESRIFRLFEQKGIPQTFAFIPRPEAYLGDDVTPARTGTPPMIDSLRSWHAGGLVEFALHGFTHVRSLGSAGEFDRVSAGKQQEMIRSGKTIADSVLGVPVRIFAPPWNQADARTLVACREEGLPIFSGYTGAEPVEGVVQVNTNAVLCPGSTGLPDAREVLAALRRGNGVRYLIVFYHSRVDFADTGSISRLSALLDELASDSTVRISTIGQIAAGQELSYRQYSAAGIANWQSGNAIDRAKVARPFQAAWRIVGWDPDQTYRLLTMGYRRGDYREATLLAADCARSADLQRLSLRGIVALLGLAVAFVVFCLVPPRAGRIMLLVGTVVSGAEIVVLHVWPVVSPNLTKELTVMSILVLATAIFAGRLAGTRRVAVQEGKS